MQKRLRVSGLGNRVSGAGCQVRVRVRALNLSLYPNTYTRDLTAETRDPKMLPATSHPGWQLTHLTGLHISYPNPYPFQKRLHLCTRHSRICTFARYPYRPCPHLPVPTCPLAASPRSYQRVNLPAGQLVCVGLANRPTGQRIN